MLSRVIGNRIFDQDLKNLEEKITKFIGQDFSKLALSSSESFSKVIVEQIKGYMDKNIANFEMLFWSENLSSKIYCKKERIYTDFGSTSTKQRLFHLLHDMTIPMSVTSPAQVKIYLHKKVNSKKVTIDSLTCPFTPLTYAETSNYIMELIMIMYIQKGSR